MTEALKKAAEERMLLSQRKEAEQMANPTPRRGSKRGSKANLGYDAGSGPIQIYRSEKGETASPNEYACILPPFA